MRHGLMNLVNTNLFVCGPIIENQHLWVCTKFMCLHIPISLRTVSFEYVCMLMFGQRSCFLGPRELVLQKVNIHHDALKHVLSLHVFWKTVFHTVHRGMVSFSNGKY